MNEIAKIQFLHSKHLAVIAFTLILVGVLGFLIGCEKEPGSPVLQGFEEEQGTLSPQVDPLRARINNTIDLLPGWSMYFFDFEPGKKLELIVIQSDPGEEGEVVEATGFGRYILGERRGPLLVTKASWHNWPDRPEGYPAEAPMVEGLARIGSIKWVPFSAQLISHGWPDTQDYDEAVLIIAETGFVEERFEGELHHGRLRSRFKEIPEGDHEKTP